MSEELDSNVMDVLSDSAREQRRRQIIEEMTAWAEKVVSFSFNVRGTHLFSFKELAYSFAKRFVFLSVSIRRMIEEKNVVAAGILARSLIETIGIGCLFSSDINKFIAQADQEKFDARMMKYLAGRYDGEVKPVNVMEGIRHLAKLDEKYMESLFAKRPKELNILRESLSAKSDEELMEKMKERISPITHYNFLSEITHPNGFGTQILFPDESNKHLFADELHAQCKSYSLAAILQGTYLISALEETEGFDERYRQAFMN